MLSDSAQYAMSFLQLLREKKIPLSKIVVQKAIFFLRAKKIPIPFSYAPYTFGPYSFDLNAALEDALFWEKLKLNNNKYELDTYDVQFPPSYQEKVENALDEFSKFVDNKYDFKTMERLGTALYCVMTTNGDKSKTKEEFLSWKRQKYSESEIDSAIEKALEIYTVN